MTPDRSHASYLAGQGPFSDDMFLDFSQAANTPVPGLYDSEQAHRQPAGDESPGRRYMPWQGQEQDARFALSSDVYPTNSSYGRFDGNHVNTATRPASFAPVTMEWSAPSAIATSAMSTAPHSTPLNTAAPSALSYGANGETLNGFDSPDGLDADEGSGYEGQPICSPTTPSGLPGCDNFAHSSYQEEAQQAKPSKKATSKSVKSKTSSKAKEKASTSSNKPKSGVKSSPPGMTTSASKNKVAATMSPPSSSSHASSSTVKPIAVASNTGYGGGHGIQLRTASRKSKNNKRECSDDDEEGEFLTPDERRARKNHNQVEKKYRERLNIQFERLLAVLPAGGYDEDELQYADGGVQDAGCQDGAEVLTEKRLSKAEVLDLAQQRIRVLEAETSKLQRERSNLLQHVDAMRDAIMRQSVTARQH